MTNRGFRFYTPSHRIREVLSHQRPVVTHTTSRSHIYKAVDPNGPFRPGDIAACFGTCAVSRAITWRTFHPFPPIRRLAWGPSHVAILCRHPVGGMIWAESTSMCAHACLFRDKRVSGVQAHDPWERIGDYEKGGGWVDLYRLVDFWSLSGAESELLTNLVVRHFIRKNVDYDTGGALLSGTTLLRRLPFVLGGGRHTLQAAFCSELIHSLQKRLNRIDHNNSTKYTPGRLMRELVADGTYRYVETFNGIIPFRDGAHAAVTA